MSVAGSCSWPADATSPANQRPKGGTKEYYCNIYALDITARSHAGWKRIGKLPIPLAYGASVTTPKGSFGSEEITIKRSPDRSSSSTGTGKNNNCISPNCRHFPCRWIISRPHTPMVACMSPGVRASRNGPNRSGRFANRPYEPTLFITANTVASKEWVRLPDFPGPARIQPVLTAQQSEDGIRLYLAGGFQPASAHQEAIVCTDMLSYHPKTKQWRNEGFLPSLAGGSHRTVTGGCAIASGDSSILLVGGRELRPFPRRPKPPRAGLSATSCRLV